MPVTQVCKAHLRGVGVHEQQIAIVQNERAAERRSIYFKHDDQDPPERRPTATILASAFAFPQQRPFFQRAAGV